MFSVYTHETKGFRKAIVDAFDEVAEEIKTLFYNCIKKGKLSQNNISELIEYFAIDKVNPESIEWKLYVEMLLDKDYPSKEIEEEFTFHRRNTITSLLSTARKTIRNTTGRFILTIVTNRNLKILKIPILVGIATN